jgi:hypothetical protein
MPMENKNRSKDQTKTHKRQCLSHNQVYIQEPTTQIDKRSRSGIPLITSAEPEKPSLGPSRDPALAR